MGKTRFFMRFLCLFAAMMIFSFPVFAQQAGGIRGVVYDKEFDAPLAGAQVSIAETGEKVTATDAGNYIFSQVEPGRYTLVFSKEGYTRQIATDVVVSSGQMADVNASLSGEFTEMEEFVVQDVTIGGNSEAGLLNLRMESPALMDSISVDLMSRAGASDAAGALRLVAGATVQDGKYAVVRGLPDRYVSSQMNGVRLPTADADKRAVQLDQFPAEAIENIQVVKSFTPDQQGDASGGAVNIMLKGVPDEGILKFSVGTEYNTQASGRNDFLTYQGGGVNFWGMDDKSRQPQLPDTNWKGPVGVSRGDTPLAYNWAVTAGGKKEIAEGVKLGGIGSFAYKRKASYYDHARNDKLWLVRGDTMLTPIYSGMISEGGVDTGDGFKTSLADISQCSEEVQWSGLGALGIESENTTLQLTYMRTQKTEDKVTLAEDTRGKDYFVTQNIPDYDPMAPNKGYRDAAPYRRQQTLAYTERSTETLQLHGEHTIPFPEIGILDYFVLLPPEIDWTVADSSSGLYSPDKRTFGSLWKPGTPDIIYGPYVFSGLSSGYYQDKPSVSYLGNIQRVWQQIDEQSRQYFANGKLPFEQWSHEKGYFKFGVFNDQVERKFSKESYSNFGESSETGPAIGWDEYWSDLFLFESHLMKEATVDADYEGRQKLSAWYYMADVPLSSFFKVIGGARYEDTDLSITIIDPEENVTWVPLDTGTNTKLNPGDADRNYKQQDVLPSIGFEFKPLEKVTLRVSYSETVARQTFKELTPIQQSEYQGGDVFIGNPDLTMSALKNYDLRVDYTPFDGSLVSVSWFKKYVKNPIEYRQSYFDGVGGLFTYPVNYPEGTLSGLELELRQQMGCLWDPLDGLSVGANATMIRSKVTLPDDEAQELAAGGFSETTRDMRDCPSILYNLNLTYDIEKTGTQLGLFYNVQGDRLVAGSAFKENYLPSVYAKQYGTLNFSLSQKIGERWKLSFKAKNLLNPEIQEVYRSDYLDRNTVKTSYKKEIEYSISASCEF